MTRPCNALAAVYLCVEPIDFRLQINGLAARVEGALLLDPLSEQLFGFTNRRYNRVKILAWERNGFVLWQKRLERDRFHWPRGDSLTVTLNGQELNWLLDGFDLRQWRPHARLTYSCVAQLPFAGPNDPLIAKCWTGLHGRIRLFAMTTPVTDLLPDDVEALKALVEHERARCLTAQDEIERLRSQLRLLLAQRFGAKREVAPEN